MVTDTNLFLIPLHAFLRSKTRYLSRSDDREAMSALRLRIGVFPLTHPIAGRTRRGRRQGAGRFPERYPEWYGYLSAWNADRGRKLIGRAHV